MSKLYSLFGFVKLAEVLTGIGTILTNRTARSSPASFPLFPLSSAHDAFPARSRPPAIVRAEDQKVFLRIFFLPSCQLLNQNRQNRYLPVLNTKPYGPV